MYLSQEEVHGYRSQGFSESQIEEIDIGLSNGLDVSIYAKKELSFEQMFQIRLGLENSLDMSKYAIPDYDWFQLEEIREGLFAGLEVRRYDSIEIPSAKMHQMRLALEHGIDLSDFLQYTPGIMQEVRKALLSKIDIFNYVESGYDEDQLREIRDALENGVDIPQYLNIDFRAASIQEIRLGLENNIDVEIYAKPCYTWAQMRELRFGLMAQIDVSYYQSPLYNRYQMEQIRLGLEEGLDVGYYTSLMYPDSVMKQIREELHNGGYRESAEVEVASEGEENRDGITVSISDDDMVAFIKINKEAFGVIGRQEILRSLRVYGITKNIDPRMVDNLLSGKRLGEVVQIAVGKPPVDGADGYYEYFFETDVVRAPKVMEDGSVDFQNMDWYEKVKAQQKLAYYHSAGKGEDGFTVTGKRIPPKRGKEMKALKIQGVSVLSDKKTYIADTDGRVDLENNKLTVSPILIVKEVNKATGNIRFPGNVFVNGDVEQGVIIEAAGDVVIDGFVSGSTIKAGGDVILKKGVNGDGTGFIQAGGAMEGKFLESVTVKAVKSIKVNYCLNSIVYTEGSLQVFGGKGLILGGRIFAACDIKAANVGNAVGVRTLIKMGVSDEMLATQRKIENKLVDLENKLLILYKSQRDFQDKYPAEIRNSMEMYIKIENAIYTLNIDKTQLYVEKEKLMKQVMATSDAMMTVTGTLYDNVLIEIDGRKIISTNSKNVTIKKVDNRVGIFKNN